MSRQAHNEIANDGLLRCSGKLYVVYCGEIAAFSNSESAMCRIRTAMVRDERPAVQLLEKYHTLYTQDKKMG